jgi:hypothetical protein
MERTLIGDHLILGQRHIGRGLGEEWEIGMGEKTTVERSAAVQ